MYAGVGERTSQVDGRRTGEQTQDEGTRGQPVVPTDEHEGLSSRRRRPDQRLERHQDNGSGRQSETADGGRDGGEDQHRAGGVPARRGPREHPVFPHHRDELRQHDVPDVAETVPQSVRSLHRKVSAVFLRFVELDVLHASRCLWVIQVLRNGFFLEI